MASPNRTPGSASSPAVPRAYGREGVAAVLLYVLLMEWLRPLAAMSAYTDIDVLKPFLITYAFFVLLEYARIPAGWNWILKLAACFVVIRMLFYPHEGLSWGWLADYGQETMKDLAAAVQFSMEGISPANRTMLFLLGWALLITVLYSTVVERHQALWLIVATLAYLVALPLWADVNTSAGVLRTFGAGMLLLAVNQPSRVAGQFALRLRAGAWPLGRWATAAALLMTLAIGAGLWLSRDEARQARPLPWNAVESAWSRLFPASSGGFASETLPPSAGLAAWTGYSDDSRLGGPLQTDDRVAFTARTEEATYWRGESRSTYTGRGWVTGGDDSAGGAGRSGGSVATGASASVTPAATLPTKPLGAGPRRTIQQEIMLEDPSLGRQLFAGGAIAQVDALVTRSGQSLAPELLAVDPATGRVAVQASEPVAYYRLAVEVPADAALRLAQPAAPSRPLTAAERAALAGDLQLPAALPERVRELARTVTAGADSDAGRAQAIEAYLRSRYAYNLMKPTVPGEGEDFVDHFLFVDQVGYCDHFSTAMVVLLRSVDVPARWVKGFAPGELSTSNAIPSATLATYTVTNRDAHSWVEVYLPEQGWVRFEPTPGFSDTPASGLDPVAPPVGGDAMTVTAAVSGTALSGYSVAGPGGASWLSLTGAQLAAWGGMLQQAVGEKLLSGENGSSLNRLILWMAALLLIPPLLWFASPRLRSALMAVRQPERRSLRAYEAIWAKLGRRVGRRRPEQTVREYVDAAVRRLPEEDQREALRQFAGLYEAARYAERPMRRSTEDKARLAELWARIARSKSPGSMR